MGKYVIQAISRSDSMRAFKTLRASFIPRIGETIDITGHHRPVTYVTHSPYGWAPIVTVDMSNSSDVEKLISVYGWRRKQS